MPIPFSSITWNELTAQVPNDIKIYRMRNLSIVQDHFEESFRHYSLVDNRSKRIICHMSVENSEDAQFKQFQNILLSSKL